MLWRLLLCCFLRAGNFCLSHQKRIRVYFQQREEIGEFLLHLCLLNCLWLPIVCMCFRRNYPAASRSFSTEIIMPDDLLFHSHLHDSYCFWSMEKEVQSEPTISRTLLFVLYIASTWLLSFSCFLNNVPLPWFFWLILIISKKCFTIIGLLNKTKCDLAYYFLLSQFVSKGAM